MLPAIFTSRFTDVQSVHFCGCCNACRFCIVLYLCYW